MYDCLANVLTRGPHAGDDVPYVGSAARRLPQFWKEPCEPYTFHPGLALLAARACRHCIPQMRTSCSLAALGLGVIPGHEYSCADHGHFQATTHASLLQKVSFLDMEGYRQNCSPFLG